MMTQTLLTFLQSEIHWKPVANDKYVFTASLDGHTLMLKINDFPEYPFVYTFVSDIATFDALELPISWSLP